MANAFIDKLRAAKRSGADMRELIEDWLDSRYRYKGRVLTILLLVAVIVGILLGAAVTALAFRNGVENVPPFSLLTQMDETGLHWLIGLSAGAAVPLFGQILQVHNGQHKNLAALMLMASGAHPTEAMKVAFEGKKDNVMLEVVGTILGAA